MIQKIFMCSCQKYLIKKGHVKSVVITGVRSTWQDLTNHRGKTDHGILLEYQMHV